VPAIRCAAERGVGLVAILRRAIQAPNGIFKKIDKETLKKYSKAFRLNKKEFITIKN
jgi:hypothetical protein